MSTPTVLITGAAKRIGAAIANELHSLGFNLILHYRHSQTEVKRLAETLNQQRAGSAICLQADMTKLEEVEQLAQATLEHCSELAGLVNNASTFYPTPPGKVTEADWDTLLGSNLKGPFFLSQALSPALARGQGAIVNIVDIYAERPLREHSVYSIAKAGVAMMTRALALELAPAVKVNGVAPGAILWPEQQSSMADEREHISQRVPMQRIGKPQDIARTVAFLMAQNDYITGQIIAVDGGRSINC